jgi:hypothetical protein
MKTGVRPFLRQSISLAAAGVLVVVLVACTGRGGGYLPPNTPLGFSGQASLGFSFSCEDKGGVNPPTGQLRVQLAYTDHGSNPLGSWFSIHGIVDIIDPVLESAVCIGQNPPPGGKQLIFLGRYRLTTGAPANFPSACTRRETPTTPLCRFEAIVQDNDLNHAPSKGDFFSIKLSSSTVTPTCTLYPPDFSCTQLPPTTVFYARAGPLAGGNLTVD